MSHKSSFSLLKQAAEEPLCRLMDVLRWLTPLWQGFKPVALHLYFGRSMNADNHIPTSQTACAGTSWACREVEGSPTLSVHGSAGQVGLRRAEDGEEDEKGRKGKRGWTGRESGEARAMWRGGVGTEGGKGRPPRGGEEGGGGDTQLDLIHFRAVNLRFPRRNSGVM